jgi:hypothetical protein
MHTKLYKNFVAPLLSIKVSVFSFLNIAHIGHCRGKGEILTLNSGATKYFFQVYFHSQVLDYSENAMNKISCLGL